MDVRRETHLNHMRRPVHTTLEWKASCAHAVNVTIGDDKATFQFGMDRQILASLLNPDPDSVVDQENSCICATAVGDKLKVVIKIKVPNEGSSRNVELWGMADDWNDFLRETELEVPLGEETVFGEEDKEAFRKLGITL